MTEPVVKDNVGDVEGEEVYKAGAKVNLEWLHELDKEEIDYDFEVNLEEDSEQVREALHPEDTSIAPRYYKWKDYFPELQKLLDNYDVLVKEMQALTNSGAWTPWPESQLYDSRGQSGDWKVIPFLYSFPAYEEGSSKWVESNLALCPKTAELLKSIPNIRTALYSRLGGNTRLSAHQGWADLANYVLRCHLPLKVPEPEEDLCGMWVDNAIQYHKPKQLLVFDDSKWHKAFNATNEDRVVLIFDILRPKTIPRGGATGGHTDKLDEFIAAFQML